MQNLYKKRLKFKSKLKHKYIILTNLNTTSFTRCTLYKLR